MANTAIRLGYLSISSGGGGGAGFEEYANLAAFPPIGEDGIIYLADDTKKLYVWTGSTYAEVSPSEVTQSDLDDKANTNLDNLIETTIPDGVGLNSLATSNFNIKTIDKETSTANLNISSGNSLLGDSGNINISTGAAPSGDKGNISLNSKQTLISTDSIPNQVSIVDNDAAIRTNLHVHSPDYSNYSHIGMADPNNTFAYFNSLDNPSRNANIGSWSSSGESGGNTFFHGSIVRGTANGSFKSGDVYLETRSESSFEDTADNLEISSGNITIRSKDGFIKGTGANANSGNITIQTGSKEGDGNRGTIELNSKNIIANVDYYNGVIIKNQFGFSNVAISTTGFGTPDNPEINFNGVDSEGVAAIQAFGKLNNSGGTTYLTSTMVYADADGSYNGGDLNISSGANAFQGVTADNASVSSGSINITTSNALAQGSFTDANSGNIVIQTGNKEGNGTRGYISLSGNHINANLTQIKNVANGTDSSDAVNLSQLSSVVSPLEDIFEIYKIYAYENNASIYADGRPGIRDTSALIRDGWYYQNNTGEKINWYFFDGNPISSTYQGAISQGNFSAYVVMTLDSKNAKPIIALYSLPTGVGDAIPSFAHSRWVYQLSTAALAPLSAGKQYLFYTGLNPSAHPEIPHIQLDFVPAQSIGDLNPAELILTSALNSESTEPAGDVQWMVESLGVWSSSIKQEMDLRIRTVPLNTSDKIDAIYLPSYVDDVVEYANLAAFPPTGETGKIYVALDTNKIYRWSGSTYIEISPSESATWGSITGTLSSQTDLQNALDAKYDASNPAGYITLAEVPESAVTSVNTRTGDIFLTKVDVGLGDVDNTSDLDKPISTATQTALDGKADTSHTQDLSTINQSGASNGQVPIWNGTSWVPGVPAGTAAWGGITGTLSSQTDLQTALDGKFDDPTGTTAEYIRGDGSLATFPTSINQANSLVTTVFNNSGAPIPKFSVVYISGGQGDLPTISLAQANNEAGSSKTYGVVYAEIPNMQSGQVIVNGALTGVNTDQFNPTAPMGDVNGVALYLSPTVPGGLTTTKPAAPDHMVYVATIVRTHQNEGVVEVRIQNGFELQELHNVQIPNGSAQNNQVLKYDSTTNLWKNKYIGLASDIEETSFSIANDQSSPANITGFAFSNTLVRSFSAIASVYIDATDDLFELVEIKGIQKSSDWVISVSSTGDVSGISFSITNTGQIQYTSNSYTGFVSGVIKFRAITISV